MREPYISMNNTENNTDFPQLQALQRPLRIKSNFNIYLILYNEVAFVFNY